MTLANYSYKYGHGYKDFSLEQDRVIAEIKVAEMPPVENLKAAILDAIYHPIDSAPINELIKPGQKVAFICNDPTRVANSFDFMPVLVNEMNKLGIKDEDMRIVFALGTHRKMTDEEMMYDGTGHNNQVHITDKFINPNGSTKRGFTKIFKIVCCVAVTVIHR